MPWLRLFPATRGSLLAAAVLLAALTMLATTLAPAHAEGTDDADADAPVGLMIATAGLTWDDIDAGATPHLQCLAENSGLGAMNTSSTTVLSTKRQGMESLHTGYRGLAETAPRSAGIPTPPTDRLAQLPAGTTEVDAAGSVPTDEVGSALATREAGSLLVVDIGSVPDVEGEELDEALVVLDERAGKVLDAAGGCDGLTTRTVLVSVAAVDPPDPDAVEQRGAVASRSAGLQVAMDSAFPGQALTSGSTHQSGLVVLTDVLPTVLASHGVEADGPLPGQPFAAEESDNAQGLAHDRSTAALLVDDASVPALGSWIALGAVGMVLLAIPRTGRRPGVRRVARALVSVSPLAFPVGLMASIVPWWQAEHPTVALTAVIWAGCLILSALVLGGPWRRSRFGPPGVAAALVAGLILLESALGSPWQNGSPLGAQPISGGRFYGLSNHLFGMVLAASLMALLCLFTRLRRPRSRVLWTVGVGAVVAAVCVAPSMGADFGSMLATIPAFGLLALLVSGIRPRLWHLLALGVGGVVTVLAVSFVDWLRPPAERTHLGRFIDELLSGDLLVVIVRKLAQNVEMLFGYPALMLAVLLSVALSVLILIPRRVHWHALAGLDEAHPSAHAVRIALVVGGWLGYIVNDTGPVLITMVLVITIMTSAPVLPYRDERPAATRGATGTI